MTTRLNPYIAFRGEARKALEFYNEVFGGKLDISVYKDNAFMQFDPSEENYVMHGMLSADNGITLMAADTPKSMEYVQGKNVSISLSGDNVDELKGYWDKLSEGAVIREPLVQAPWGDTFGMLTDKFGIEWMVNIASGTPPAE